jgi:hypothetical protein
VRPPQSSPSPWLTPFLTATDRVHIASRSLDVLLTEELTRLDQAIGELHGEVQSHMSHDEAEEDEEHLFSSFSRARSCLARQAKHRVLRQGEQLGFTSGSSEIGTMRGGHSEPHSPRNAP